MYCKNCGIEIPLDSKFCFSCGVEQKVTSREIAKELGNFDETLYKLKVFIDSKSRDAITDILSKIISSREHGNRVLRDYSLLFNRDLIEDLSNLSNSYDRIKSYVQRFIDFKIVEPKYPHKRITEHTHDEEKLSKSEDVEIDWKTEALKPKSPSKNGLRWVIGLLFLFGLYIIGSILIEPKLDNQKSVRQIQIETQFNSWDGSHMELTKMIKRSMNDPESFMHVETKYTDWTNYIIVFSVYSGTNAYGGRVKEFVKAKISNDGKIEILEQGKY